MEMNELFYKDVYQTSFDSRVVSCVACKRGYDVVLEDTVFYPEGGGQPCDIGTLDGVEVFDVQRDGHDVIHHYAKKCVDVGKIVHGEINWQRRFDLMQNHSGEHIVSGLVHKKYGYENVGFHMGEVIQIDLSGPLRWEQLLEIEQEANEAVWKDMPITITYPDEAELSKMEYRSKKELIGKVRIVTIGNVDVCACCGTHVSHTGEIGLIKILSCEKHKDGVRVEMVCGKRAVSYMENAYEQVRDISMALSSKPLLIGNAVQKLVDANENLIGQIKECHEQILMNHASNIKTASPLVIDFVTGIPRNTLVNYANLLVEEKDVRVACVMNGEETGVYSYVILSHQVDLKKYAKDINEVLHGRGGGKSEILQGSFYSTQEEITKVLSDFFL